jgi:hypothetical protein
MQTSMAVRAHPRPAAYGVPAKLTTSAASASRATVSLAVEALGGFLLPGSDTPPYDQTVTTASQTAYGWLMAG